MFGGVGESVDPTDLKSVCSNIVVTTVADDKYCIEGLTEGDVDRLFVNEYLTDSLKDVVYSVDEALNRFGKKIS